MRISEKHYHWTLLLFPFLIIQKDTLRQIWRLCPHLQRGSHWITVWLVKHVWTTSSGIQGGKRWRRSQTACDLHSHPAHFHAAQGAAPLTAWEGGRQDGPGRLSLGRHLNASIISADSQGSGFGSISHWAAALMDFTPRAAGRSVLNQVPVLNENVWIVSICTSQELGWTVDPHSADLMSQTWPDEHCKAPECNRRNMFMQIDIPRVHSGVALDGYFQMTDLIQIQCASETHAQTNSCYERLGHQQVSRKSQTLYQVSHKYVSSMHSCK